MKRNAKVHCAQQRPTGRPGVEAVSVVSNHRFPRHAHDDYGIGLLDKGAQQTWSTHGKLEAIAGDVIAFNPAEIHDGAPMNDDPRSWRIIYFKPAVVANEVGEETTGQLEIKSQVLKAPILGRQFNRLFALVTSDGDQLAVEEAAASLFMNLLHRHSAHASSKLTPAPGIGRARQLLDEEPARSVSLAELAAQAGVSRFQLIRGFARDVGVTPHAYQVQQRVRLARRLLGARWKPAAAAVEAGFADQSHMTRAFVRQFGVTPAAYRRALGLSPRQRCNNVQDAPP